MSIEKVAYSAEVNYKNTYSPNIAELVQKYGGSASVALLDPACHFFSTPSTVGVIGYRTKSHCAVVFGDPVCPQEDKLSLALEFRKYCKKNNLRIVYAMVTESFAHLWTKHGCKALVEVGEELVLNPQFDYLKGSKGRKLRTKIHQAQHLGVHVHEYQNHDLQLESELEKTAYSWLLGRKGLQIYLAHVHLFSHRSGKRWFYATQGNRIVGTLLLNQFQAKKGWGLNLLMTTPKAPQSTSEYLVVSALQTLKEEGCPFFTLGSVPAQKLGEIQGLNAIYAWIARVGFNAAINIFNLHGRKMYWSKFHPQCEGCYFLFEKQSIGLKEIKGVLSAFNVGK